MSAAGLVVPKPWRSSAQFVSEVRREIEWLIPGVLPRGAVVLLNGREGSMKSFLALSMAHAVATGKPWLGKQTEQGAVLYLDGEMDSAVLSDRLRGTDPDGQVQIWAWTDDSFPDQLNDAVLQQAAKEHSLIIIDPLRRHMDGLKENSADDMSQITKALRELKRYGATVLVLHHAPKDTEKQDYRGSTELGAGVDLTMILTTKETKDGAVLTLRSRKTRYGTKCHLEIEAKEAPRAPVFTLHGEDSAQSSAKDSLLTLSLRVDELRERIGRDPIQDEIIQEAGKVGLGAKDKIRQMLKDGEGRYWRVVKEGRKNSYAPPT